MINIVSVWKQTMYVPNPSYGPQSNGMDDRIPSLRCKYLCIEVGIDSYRREKEAISVGYSWCDTKRPSTWYDGCRVTVGLLLDANPLKIASVLKEEFSSKSVPQLVKDNFDIFVKLSSTAIKVIKASA